ncbi:hypothetical protein N7492_003584 [Penicillium capsulatum]|uniref:Vacuolar sorting protein Vps3844 C-terminal domain-containing protein n=1 Tax=Penicillium capsulatum TaxID=69766 RepID=A0A9W9IJV2_9EURO|nr:hypothetical protein N7492_003584 [Penicillium capsulatum]KAJ6121833.1 hypothetical protein N7512_004298 [Penicillium capsulatum]
MRWVSKLLALAATGAVGTTALESSIFTFPVDKLASKNDVPEQVVSEDVARSILELRSKSSVASVLGKVDTDTVDRLNQFADGQMTLFAGSDSQESMERHTIVFEGLDRDVDMNLRKGQGNRILVPHSSSALVDNTLESVAESDSKGRNCIYHGSGKSQTKGAKTAQECISLNPVLSRGHGLFDRDLLNLVGSAETWVSQDQKTAVSRIAFKARSDENKLITQSLDAVFQELNDVSSEGKREITVIFSPHESASKNPRRVLERRDKSWVDSSTAHSSVLKSGKGLPVHHNLAPVCHATNSSCAEATNNCSGHGSCYLKSGSESEGSANNCYACRCQQTVVRKSDGTTQKIQWGGPACEKKDISSSFWLIAGVSVLLVLLVGSGIGMLFSMGQQELPSVISAGVGGSKTQG